MSTDRAPQIDLREPKERERFLASLPHLGGVYIMRGADQKVLYVGKANDLHNRVSSYFGATSDERYFVAWLPRLVHTIEILIVSSEREALLLENTLIKELHPRFNVLLRDDKTYLSIRLDMGDPYPRFVRVRGTPKKDGALYFGPYHSGRSVHSIIGFVNRHFKFRTCNNRTFSTRKRPCLRYHLKLCEAPCTQEIPKKRYRTRVREAILFLRGEKDALVKRLKRRMHIAAEELEFEQAALVRDILFALEKISQPQSVVTSDFTPTDIVGFAREEERIALVILEMRRGAITTHRQLLLELHGISPREYLESYLLQHYTALNTWPERIWIPFSTEAMETLGAYFSEQAGHPVELTDAPKAEHARLMGLAAASARSRLTLMGELEVEDQLKTLAKKLKMKRMPRVVECYDISHLQGRWAIGSMVVFVDGKPAKKRYRRFNIKSGVGGDDFASLREVLQRRLARREEEGWALPDLMVIDGGKGQLNVVTAVFTALGVPYGPEATSLISLAKERDPDGPPDRFFLPGRKNAVHLRGSGRELYILAHLRDEAHRFAIEGHRNRRRGARLSTTLTQIAGVGPALASRLLTLFGSAQAVGDATLEELTLVKGVGPALAQKIHTHLHPPKDPHEETPPG